MEPPRFNVGNVSFRNALNQAIEYAKRHGVNPAGRPGWSETADGWMPPYFVGGDTNPLRRWSLKIADRDLRKVQIENPGQIKRTSALDNTGEVLINDVAAEFPVSDGDFLLLEVTRNLTTTLKVLDTWDGFPMPIDTEESGGTWTMLKYYFPLWRFAATATDPNAVKIDDTLSAVRMAPDSDLQFYVSREQDKDGHVVSAIELRPSAGYVP